MFVLLWFVSSLLANLPSHTFSSPSRDLQSLRSEKIPFAVAGNGSVIPMLAKRPKHLKEVAVAEVDAVGDVDVLDTASTDISANDDIVSATISASGTATTVQQSSLQRTQLTRRTRLHRVTAVNVTAEQRSGPQRNKMRRAVAADVLLPANSLGTLANRATQAATGELHLVADTMRSEPQGATTADPPDNGMAKAVAGELSRLANSIRSEKHSAGATLPFDAMVHDHREVLKHPVPAWEQMVVGAGWTALSQMVVLMLIIICISWIVLLVATMRSPILFDADSKGTDATAQDAVETTGSQDAMETVPTLACLLTLPDEQLEFEASSDSDVDEPISDEVNVTASEKMAYDLQAEAANDVIRQNALVECGHVL